MRAGFLPGVLALAAACGGPTPEAVAPPPTSGRAVAVVDTVMTATVEAVGVAAPRESATLSTRLMARVTEVTVVEGQPVQAGQLLVRLDVADLIAKQRQAEAAAADAVAQRDLARLTATRMRALLADSAAPRAQVDLAEAGLARAEAGVRATEAALAELGATLTYGEIRAPFDGIVASRSVDVGDFVAPGTPVMVVDRRGELRVAATVAAPLAAGLRPGDSLVAVVEGDVVGARIEGIARGGGGTYTINALVANPGGAILPGSAATLRLPTAERRVLLVPATAVTSTGDLHAVRRRTASGDLHTIVRLGATVDDRVEVVAGLVRGDSVVLAADAGTD